MEKMIVLVEVVWILNGLMDCQIEKHMKIIEHTL
jgi:hypothetical protein